MVGWGKFQDLHLHNTTQQNAGKRGSKSFVKLVERWIGPSYRMVYTLQHNTKKKVVICAISYKTFYTVIYGSDIVQHCTRLRLLK